MNINWRGGGVTCGLEAVCRAEGNKGGGMDNCHSIINEIYIFKKGNRSRSLSPLFFSGSFIVSCLIFKSLMPFVVNFYIWYKIVVEFSFLSFSFFLSFFSFSVHFSQHRLLKKLFFSHCIFLAPMV